MGLMRTLKDIAASLRDIKDAQLEANFINSNRNRYLKDIQETGRSVEARYR